MAISFEGAPMPGFLAKLVSTGDVPSVDNKAYEHPLDADGGISPNQGIFANQTVEAAKVNIVDRITSKVDLRQILTLGAIIAGVLILLKVIRK